MTPHFIINLLDAIAANPQPPDVAIAAAQVQRALDDGTLACMVRHPASEPPDNNRYVLIYSPFFGCREGYAHNANWYYYSAAHEFVRTNSVIHWWELPEVDEVKE